MMGEYAYFVWPCYGAVVVILSVLGFVSWKNKRKDEKKLEELNNRLNKIYNQD